MTTRVSTPGQGASGDDRIGLRRADLLRARGSGLLQMTRDLGVDDTEIDPGSATGLRRLDGQLAILGGRLREQLASATEGADWQRLARSSHALSEVHTVRYGIHEFLSAERLRRLARLERGLEKLRRVQDPEELLAQVCQAVAECCGFDRVMLSRVDGSVWRPFRSFGVTERAADERFREWIAGIPEMRFDHRTVESEIVRRRGPAIVDDSDPRISTALVELSGTSSYVVAPLIPEDKVVGFLHADRENDAVVPLDRDVLAAFARSFDHIFERAVLLQRLAEQRDRVRAAMQSVDAALEELAHGEIELSTRAPGPMLVSSRLVPLQGGSGFGTILTKREVEVLSLMATGASNDRIGEALVIAGGTVKSHVKQILRKLRVENRAEAIALYLRETIGRGRT
ncbi:GAF domain-containing protein [Nakamurella sp. YIM 132087]|uniref:GAF domain-containing protein n=1 Tax=Nakamurella alba TaxID=2665158 RepID=A0A7K1FGQ2_9ACTN|nr:LuxR C-terminal-related transcriptional regulator [Nakamurella alba]MTD12463.1 GAF domain-containing protein [Nakamurella alba]